MYKTGIIFCFFLVLAAGGCVQGPEEEMGADLRKGVVEWPSPRKAPQERPEPRRTLEQR